MRKLFAIIVCKLGHFVGKLIGKGSSMPGKFALKICPDILRRVERPRHIIAVTGSNGKTSTVEMIAAVLRAAGKTVVYNEEGSNQIEGVTTLVLTHATPPAPSSFSTPRNSSSPTSTGTSSPGTGTRSGSMTRSSRPSTPRRS